MDLIDLGFVDITPEPEKTNIQKILDEFNAIGERINKGEITRKEGIELRSSLREKNGIPHTNFVSKNRTSEH